MEAGRSILLNSNITTNDGAVTLIANETAANGVVDAYRDAGAAVITMADGTTLGSSVDAAIVTLTNTTGTIAFNGNLTATTLNTANQGYNVSMTGSANTITDDVNFLNTGTVTIGDAAGDSSTFN